MTGLKAITTVYSYRPPEVRRVIDKVVKNGFPHHVLMGGIMPPGALDNFDNPVAEMLVDYHKESVPALKDFKYIYPTAGSEQGIMEAMSRMQFEANQKLLKYLDELAHSVEDVDFRQGISQIIDTTENWRKEKIYVVDKFRVLKGEYEGYKSVAETRAINTVEVDFETDPQSLEAGYWFISNPSARYGNIIDNDFITRICEAGHKVFYDLAYLDSTRPHVFDLSHPNIFAVVVSFSKPYGLFYDRIGFTLSREPIDSLYGSKMWFKNIFALMIAKAVDTELNAGELYQRYRRVQEEIVEEINNELHLGMKPSDALLLGHITKEDAQKLDPQQLEMIERFKRGDFYRFCLTPYYLERDPERNKLLEDWHAYVSGEREKGRDFLTPEQWAALHELRKEYKTISLI